VTTAAGWPVGVALTSWSYMWRTTPLRRSEVRGSAEDDAPPSIPDGVALDELQHVGDGVGPLFHRLYRACIRETRLAPPDVLAQLTADPNRATPTQLARFHKVRGQDGSMRPGDEYVVRMPGPWDGPVRAVAVTPASFRLATLAGHLEAGQIEFRSGPWRDGLAFEIESWARAGDRVSNLMYDRLRMAKEVQLHMWTSFLERVARLSGGRLTGGIRIRTRRVDAWERGA
jgi:Domain of unknown function (DUF1990)